MVDITWTKRGDAGADSTAGSQVFNALNLYFTDSDQLGVIKKEGLRFLHDFKHSTGKTVAPDGFNTFVGLECGNFTMGADATDISHGSYNTGVGYRSLLFLTTGQSNTAVGYRALQDVTSGDYNVAMGRRALHDLINGIGNVAIGHGSQFTNTSSSYNVSMGYHSLYANVGERNVALGHNALELATDAFDAVAVGYNACKNHTVADRNVAVGSYALFSTTTGGYNTGVGMSTLYNNLGGIQNVAVGYQAMYAAITSTACTALGTGALRYFTGGTAAEAMLNSSGLGNSSRVSGDNQVQLGNASTTTYAYGAVQDRSDERDKADIRDTVLGLEFINKLRPVDFRWDMRDDYAVEVDGEMTIFPKDGSRKRSRYHHGLIAQQVAQVITDTGMDFGGYQDHSVNGGRDVLSLGYTEFIGPLIKAVQELTQRVETLEQTLIDHDIYP